ncbi:DNA-binding Ku protein [Geotalea daltonii FRC-32]|uniref:Non-homologous end joining protein Ku n=1 Tax=Geotalea daltonii (strain DSM 22248 / JCM 15807 / FRC-32) TaxID=316067 RepID=B9LYX6_GEODF|nr:Ku protein [Geotalea daltonii]ACM18708.1 DNA-binding Ku protein [Geotalea daltonii FRC-32]
MKAIWTGSISFGLVNIPVKLFSGSESNSLDLNLLHKTDLHPINYIKVCKAENREVPMSEIVKGYQHASGEYIVLTEQDFEIASVEKTHLIDILDFVDEQEIDSRYFERPYYLEPDKTGAKPYALLREALKKSGKVGIASYVLRNRGSIGIVKPLEDVLVLNQMRYQEEVRSHAELKLPQGENLRQQEIDLALMLIDQYSTRFDPAKYKDSYMDDLKRIIEEKAQGIQPQPQGKRPQPSNVVDMMALLKKSLEEKKRKAA